jgi:MYXO-CTERM domain-containing protein
MRRLRSSLSLSFVVALLGIAAFDAPRAAACVSALDVQRLVDGETQPATGAVDVPTNARIFFASTEGNPVSTPTATLQRGDDEPTSATVEQVPGGFLLTGVALEPLTTYTARLALFEQVEDPDTGEVIEEPETTGEIVFTTGDATDTTTPSWDGDALVDTVHVPGSGPLEWLFMTNCGPARAHDIHTITPPDVSADVAVIELRLSGPEGEAFVVAAGAPGTPLEHQIFDSTIASYELVAIDIAGNESEPLEVLAAGNSGCSATDANDAGFAAVVTVALALLRRRRRS